MMVTAAVKVSSTERARWTAGFSTWVSDLRRLCWLRCTYPSMS